MIKSGRVSVHHRHHQGTARNTFEKRGLLQLELLDSAVCEVAHNGVRYVLRRNPVRAEEIALSRADKQAPGGTVAGQSKQLSPWHPGAAVATTEKAVRARIQQLEIAAWLQIEVFGRTLVLRVDSAARAEAAQLDGCYVIKTDLPVSAASTQEVHDHFKDLTQVEQAFRTCKTIHLETPPIHVRTETRSCSGGDVGLSHPAGS
jgi:hypothetical protein